MSKKFLSTILATVGNANVAPLKLQAGTNLTTPAGGSFEYDGDVAYFTPDSAATATTNGGRGLIESSHYWVIASPYTYTNNTSVQPVFGATGAFAASASATYKIEMFMRVSTTNASTISMSFGGTVGVSSLGWESYAAFQPNNSARGTIVIAYWNSGTGGVVYNVSDSGYKTIKIVGILKTTTAGTFIPQITFTSTPGSSPLDTSSWWKMTPIGTSSVTTIGAFA